MPVRPEELPQLRREIEILRACRSPFIVAYFGSYLKEDDLWLIMEYCDAGSVADLMKTTEYTLSESQISAVCRSVLRGL